MIWLIAYVTIAMIVTLGFSAWDNGVRWNTNKYIIVGVSWVLSLPLIILVLVARNLTRKRRNTDERK